MKDEEYKAHDGLYKISYSDAGRCPAL